MAEQIKGLIFIFQTQEIVFIVFPVFSVAFKRSGWEKDVSEFQLNIKHLKFKYCFLMNLKLKIQNSKLYSSICYYLAILLLPILVTVTAQDITLRPSISVRGEYDDNVY